MTIRSSAAARAHRGRAPLPFARVGGGANIEAEYPSHGREMSRGKMDDGDASP